MSQVLPRVRRTQPRPSRRGRTASALLASGAFALLTACGGGGESASTAGPQSASPAAPEARAQAVAAAPLPMLRQDGRLWRNAAGQQVNLRGTNLGNWLQLEFWMMPFDAATPDQCTLENRLTARFGRAEKERLMQVFRDHWITTRDWDLMQQFGLNVVRLPFWYSLIEDETRPYTLRPDAWKYLDRAIDEAEKRGMYTILDLHGAVGSQGWEHHSGCAGKNEYWGNAEYRNRTRWLWQQIAQRYRDRGAVAGYGLLNEPWGTTPENLANVITDLYHAVRQVDPKHVVILPGHAAGIDAYGTPASRGMHNVAFEMHFYPGFFGWGEPSYPVHNDWLYCGNAGTGGVCEWERRLNALNTPFLVGEFQPWTAIGALGPQLGARHYDVYNHRGWGATSWSYKTLSRDGQAGDGSAGWPWGMVTNPAGARVQEVDTVTASAAQIEAYFRSFGTLPLVKNEALQRWMTLKHSAPGRIEAESFTWMQGVQTEPTSDGGTGINAGWLDARDWMSYPVNVSTSGTYRVSFRVASPNGGGRVILSQDARDLAVATVPATGGWQNWTTVSALVPLKAGQQTLTVYIGAGGFNLNWWQLDRP
ncbi:carbohydrate-binding protein [Aquabacterium sp. A7-Y]|uniref:cellulase family glycosylhydrolase n=1 Tax=Aquabacterium sp. A7-Y TaxID=1349605 RepID=UPI00223D89BF|nr:cellulase family glycosylhydrolase [Aquabacterium sp. A7-Y]MCW7539132.1 carbohydrate-binding protein [Aquabacterium sp. A7-Y]